jgi:hypothetical protein
MLFNSGTPSLLSHTRFLVNDPSSVASQLFTDPEVKNAINDAYLLLIDEARLQETGTLEKRTYSTSVADQLFYSLPNDYMKMITVEVDTNGSDLSASGSNATFLKPIASDTGLEGYEKGLYDNTEFYFIHGNEFAVIKPPATGGSNAIRLTYEGHGTALSGDTDEPVIRDPYQYLICMDAAIILKSAVDLTVAPELMQRRQRMYSRFMESMSENVGDFDGQITVAGRLLQRVNTVTGFIQRGRRSNDRSRWPQ